MLCRADQTKHSSDKSGGAISGGTKLLMLACASFAVDTCAILLMGTALESDLRQGELGQSNRVTKSTNPCALAILLSRKKIAPQSLRSRWVRLSRTQRQQVGSDCSIGKEIMDWQAVRLGSR